MNWGYKIIIVYAVFVSGMLFLAFQSSRQKVELVTDDYYGKELLYQQKIDEMARTALLKSPLSIKMNGADLVILFPQDFAGKAISGEVMLYCPSDAGRDIRQQFGINNSVLVIPVPGNYQGLHYVKIDWSVDGVTYYYEYKLIIGK